jgi:hypothetical protein
VRSHYNGAEATRERVYASGESVAAWLGLGCWTDVVTMQEPERIDRLRKMIREKRG